MTIWTASYLAGLGLIIVAALGGGIEIKELKVPPLRPLPRILSFVCGCVLFGLALGQTLFPDIFSNTGPKPVPPHPIPAPVPPSPPTAQDAQFYVQLASAPMDATSRDQARATLSKFKNCGNYVPRVFSSNEFPKLRSGFWITALGPYTRSEATDVKDNFVQCGVTDALVRQFL